MTAPAFAQPARDNETGPAAVMRERMHAIAMRAADTPRSHQTGIGLSEYADECVRKLGYKLAGKQRVNSGGDSWAATLGTWGHAGLDATLRNGPDAADWLLDHKVLLGGMVPGTLDAFHIPTGDLYDFKFGGPDTIKTYQRTGPPAGYIGQAHGYGAALAAEGYEVRNVALAFFPRSHDLSALWVWTEPFRPEVPARALARLEALHDMLDELGLWDGGNPQHWGELPAMPSRRCTWCPFYRPGSKDPAVACPGLTGGNT